MAAAELMESGLCGRNDVVVTFVIDANCDPDVVLAGIEHRRTPLAEWISPSAL
jgi:hypothetical protein